MFTNPGHLTEFLGGFNGTCGECAAEVCFAAADGTRVSGSDMIAITHEMQAHGEAGGNGATTLWALAREAERRGYKINTEWDYAEPFPHDWVSLIRQYAGVKPILLQHAKGRYLHDVETGSADEATLDYHFTAILNKQSDGYVDNDGDNPQVTQRYQVYNLQTLMNSGVCGVLVLEPNQVEVKIVGLGTGFQAYVTAHKVTAKCVLTDTKMDNGWIIAAFDNGLILLWDGQNVLDTKGGDITNYLLGEVAALKSRPTVTVPPELQSVLAEASNALAPFAHLAADVAAVQKKLGY